MIGRLKTAEELAKRNHSILKEMLAGTAGLGAGMATGYLGVKGLDAALKRMGGAGIPVDSAVRHIGPVAAGGLGMALASWQAHQREMMERARSSQ